VSFAALWLGAGFASGALRIAAPERRLRAALRTLDDSPRRVDVVEGRLDDFWTGRPPRARTTLRAQRLRVGAAWVEFPAEVVVFVSGLSPVEGVAGRGDRVRVTGRLEHEDVPASDREVPRPWTRLRMSCKSALMLERIGGTWRSAVACPNRRLFAGLERADPGARDPRFDRDVRGPLAALLLGRTSELDAGMVARYRRGGLYHLLVVSGLHVVLAGALILSALTALRVEGKPRDAILLASVWLFVAVRGRQSAGRARRARRLDPARDAARRVAHRRGAGARPLGDPPPGRRPAGALLGGHDPDVRGGERHGAARASVARAAPGAAPVALARDRGRARRGVRDGAGAALAIQRRCGRRLADGSRHRAALRRADRGRRGDPRPLRRRPSRGAAARSLRGRKPRARALRRPRRRRPRSCGPRRRSRQSSPWRRSSSERPSAPRRARPVSLGAAVLLFAALALRRGPAGPERGPLGRGARRGAGRRDTRALEEEGAARGRRPGRST
jgi:hypothetical protein